MKVDKFDIGAEIISILTKGMYPDPRDAVREYIQNSIDAKSDNIEIKVRQNSVVIEDDGVGMNYRTLRKAIRVGVSDKTPGKDVGFMGIGLYSAFHLCDTLTIYTKQKDILPQMLEINFLGMRELLKIQKTKRLSGEIKSEDLIDLQSLLSKFIVLPGENEIELEEFPIEQGTRVELIGLNPILDDLLNNFNDLYNYLQDVVPLHFNNEKFNWAKTIENKIQDVCKRHNVKFEVVNLKLQVGSKIENLFRPYTNDIFTNNTPLEPHFEEISDKGVFLGLAWGCLNSGRERILNSGKDNLNRNLRGFILKKQGFSIGDRQYFSSYFGGSNTYYHRYTGEIIIINENILPNAARNDIETSDLKKLFLYQIQAKVVPAYTAIAYKFQEQNIASEVLSREIGSLKRILGEYNPYEDNFNVFINQIKEIDESLKSLKKKEKKFSPDDKKEYDNIKLIAEKLRKEISQKFEEIKTKKKSSKKVSNDTTVGLAKELGNIKSEALLREYDSLQDLMNDLEIICDDSTKKFIELLDEYGLKSVATTKSEYIELLNKLREDFENE
ncbi:MAG: ATP-binding protein [Flavobacteriales bacterium]|nr:ATP-binding protein [Flavobacteriales bacterium]